MVVTHSSASFAPRSPFFLHSCDPCHSLLPPVAFIYDFMPLSGAKELWPSKKRIRLTACSIPSRFYYYSTLSGPSQSNSGRPAGIAALTKSARRLRIFLDIRPATRMIFRERTHVDDNRRSERQEAMTSEAEAAIPRARALSRKQAKRGSVCTDPTQADPRRPDCAKRSQSADSGRCTTETRRARTLT